MVLIILITSFAGCAVVMEEPIGEATIRVGSLKGATSMGLVGLMEEDEKENTKNDYDFTITGTADEIVALLGKGELDVAAIPANLSSILYNKMEGNIKVAALNTLGVLYIVENGNQLSSIEDLRGKTIYSTGKGTTPEHVLNYILASNSLEVGKDVNIEFKTEATEVANILATQENTIALLPQPFITASQGKNDKIKTVFSIEDEWAKINKNSSQVTGVLVARKEFIEENKVAFDLFLEEYNASVEYVNSNEKDAGVLIGELGIVPAPIAEKAIPLCNIVFITEDDMEQKLSSYLEVLYNSDPQAVGGKLPDEGFYYKK